MSEGANGGGWEKYWYSLNWPWFVSRIQLHWVSGRCIQVETVSLGEIIGISWPSCLGSLNTWDHISLELAVQWPNNKDCTNISAWVKGAQLKNSRFGAPLLLIPPFSSWGTNFQRQLDTAWGFQDLWNANTALFASWPFTQNICSSINEKKTLWQFNNFFYLCFSLSGKWGHTLMSPWHSMAVVVMFENFWLVSSGSWCHCPLSCILSGKVKPAWLGDIYRWKFWSNWGKKMGPASALESWVSVPDDPVELAVSTFVLCHRKAACDAALASIKEQKAFQCSHHELWAMSIWFNYLKETSDKAKDFDPAPSWKNTLENCWLL